VFYKLDFVSLQGYSLSIFMFFPIFFFMFSLTFLSLSRLFFFFFAYYASTQSTTSKRKEELIYFIFLKEIVILLLMSRFAFI
jgi:hypothetical protein